MNHPTKDCQCSLAQVDVSEIIVYLC